MTSTTSGSRYKFVMLIDDNEIDNYLNERTLQKCNFAEKIHVNSSGISAFEFLTNLAKSGTPPEVTYPEVIFIDINMPIMDGFQFIKNLMGIEDDKFRDSRLVILTSSEYSKDRDKANAISEKILFFNKPLTAEQLEQI